MKWRTTSKKTPKGTKMPATSSKPVEGPGPAVVKDCSIRRPHVTRSACPSVNDEELPIGVQLTGGEKLRRAGLTGKNVRVAVIDSGVDESHPGFDGRVTKQVWFRGGTSLSEDDHGTHVAGTIHFMAPDAEIYDYRVFGETGEFAVEDAISTAIVEACFDGCQVINMSLGGRWPGMSIRTAVKFAHSQGVHVVCAAGNDGDGDPLTNERSYPAMWDEAISIAAVQKAEKLPVAVFSNSNPRVDYAGIGVDVVSMKPFGGFHTMSGTSMAAPHVTGLIAALLTSDRQKKPLTDEELRKMLNDKETIDIDVKGIDNSTGLGFLTFLDKKEFEGVLRSKL